MAALSYVALGEKHFSPFGVVYFHSAPLIHLPLNRADLRLLHTPRELAARTADPGLQEQNDVILFSQPWFGSSRCKFSPHHPGRTLFVSENYCVIGQFEVGAECAKCLAFRVTCAAVGGPFADLPGVLRLSSRGV